MRKIWISLILAVVVFLLFSYAGKIQLAEMAELEPIIENSEQQSENQGDDHKVEVSNEELSTMEEADYPVFAMEKDIYREYSFEEGDFWVVRIDESLERSIKRTMTIDGAVGQIHQFDK